MLTFGYDVKETLKEAANNTDVKAVLLHIITPGGTIYGSQAIAEGVEIFKSSGKPIFAFIEGLAASGEFGHLPQQSKSLPMREVWWAQLA